MDVKFQTGLFWQDCQHEEWIALLAQLKKDELGKNDPQMFRHTISFIVMYVNSHFSLEKVYMEKYNYPEKRFHLEEHRLYIMRLKDFREKFCEYSNEAILNVIENMNEWIYSHIMENDKKLGLFVLKHEQPNFKSIG